MIKLLKYGKEKSSFLLIQSFFSIIPSFIITYVIYIISKNENFISNFDIAFIGGLILITVIYQYLFSTKITNVWGEIAKKKIISIYFEKLKSSNQELDEAKFLQNDLRGFDHLDSFFGVFFPEMTKLLLMYIPIIVFSVLFRNYLFISPIIVIYIIVISMKYLSKKTNHANKRYIGAFTNLGKRFLGDLSIMKTLVMYNADENFQNDFDKDSEYFRQKTMDVLSVQLKSLIVLSFSIIVGVIFSIFSIKYSNIEISKNIQIAVIFYMLNFLFSFRQAGYFFHIVKSSKPSFDRIFEVIESYIDDENYGIEIKDIENIEICNLNLSFGDKKIFEDTSVKFERGKLNVLIGENGSGKSTLSKILLKELGYEGSVKIQGLEVSEISKTSINSNISYMKSESHIFDTTINENLIMSSKSYLEKIRKYNLLSFVGNLEDSFETKVGEKGHKLSQGQRQQIAFARQILADKNMYIFDEVTSSIDKNNRSIIVNAIRELAKDKMIIYITHSLDDILKEDNVFRLENGKVIGGFDDNKAS